MEYVYVANPFYKVVSNSPRSAAGLIYSDFKITDNGNDTSNDCFEIECNGQIYKCVGQTKKILINDQTRYIKTIVSIS